MAVHSRFLVCHLSSYAKQYQFQLADNLLWESVLSFHLATHMLWRNFIAQQAIHHGLVSCPLALKGSLSCSSAWLQWPKYYPPTGPSRACMMKKNYQNKDEDCHLLSPWTVPWQPSLQAHVLVLDLASPCKLETGTQNGWPNPHGSKLYFHAWRVSKSCIV